MIGDDKERVSSDLIRWLKLLALPKWAKAVLALVMLLALAAAVYLVAEGVLQRDKDALAAGVSILTVGLPVGLVVVALLFGDGGARTLRDLTLKVLEQEIPAAIRTNLSHGALRDSDLSLVTRGYISDYLLRAQAESGGIRQLRFRVELNVRKVNVVFWVPADARAATAPQRLQAEPLMQACWVGAEREGYALNPVLLVGQGREAGLSGMVFIKTLHEDFLLEPAQRLYFAQDFAFFVRGMLEAVLHSPEAAAAVAADALTRGAAPALARAG